MTLCNHCKHKEECNTFNNEKTITDENGEEMVLFGCDAYEDENDEQE